MIVCTIFHFSPPSYGLFLESAAVIELLASSASGVSMMECPKEPGVEIRSKLPVLVMIVKNMQKYFSFEVQLRTEVTFPHPRAALHLLLLRASPAHCTARCPPYPANFRSCRTKN